MSTISLGFVSFINYFLVPIIGLKIYNERHNKSCKVSFDTLYLYVLITVLNLPFTRIFVNLAEGVMGKELNSESSIYTIVAAVTVVILIYVLEVIEKLIAMVIEIEGGQDAIKKNK